jgi:hypothetical protein
MKDNQIQRLIFLSLSIFTWTVFVVSLFITILMISQSSESIPLDSFFFIFAVFASAIPATVTIASFTVAILITNKYYRLKEIKETFEYERSLKNTIIKQEK